MALRLLFKQSQYHSPFLFLFSLKARRDLHFLSRRFFVAAPRISEAKMIMSFYKRRLCGNGALKILLRKLVLFAAEVDEPHP